MDNPLDKRTPQQKAIDSQHCITVARLAFIRGDDRNGGGVYCSTDHLRLVSGYEGGRVWPQQAGSRGRP